MSVFETLNKINVNEHTETKNRLTYLSWAWAWAEVKKAFPNATYTIYENNDGWNYFTDGRTCWVKTGVTIEGLEHIEYLPIMDFKNASIPLDKVTSFDVNKAIQRSLTKAVARHGLGLYIYAGEDLPEGEEEQKPEKKVEKKAEKICTEEKPLTDPNQKINKAQCGALMNRISGEKGLVKAITDLILISYKVELFNELTIANFEQINRNWAKLVAKAKENESKNK